VQPFGADQPKHAIAQELQALVGGIGAGAGVGQGALEQTLVREDVAKPRLKISR
jgi:hypothetical protein